MSKSPPPVSVIIIGAGNRGARYAAFAKMHPDRMRVVGVAEPRDFFRGQLAANYDLPVENVVATWQALADRPRLADAVIIATQDAQHVEPALAFAERGYAMLLEKPMAPNAADCRRIVSAVRSSRRRTDPSITIPSTFRTMPPRISESTRSVKTTGFRSARLICSCTRICSDTSIAVAVVSVPRTRPTDSSSNF